MNKQISLNFYVIFIMIFLSVYQIAYSSSSKDNVFNYWVPYVDTQHYGASVTKNYLEIYAFEDSTFIQADTDSFYLNIGNSIKIERPLLCEGLQVISDKPIQLHYYFLTGHYGRYEDGSILYYLLEESHLGTEYWIPTPNTVISVLATQDNSYITVGDDGYNLNKGQTVRLYSIPAGSSINSDKPIMVVAINYTSDHYGSTFAYEIYPTTSLGTNYFSPHQHSYSYQSSTDSTMLYVMAPWDSTSVTVDSVVFELNQGDYIANTCTTEVSITSTKPVYSIYLSDIYARDPWASVYRHYSYALSLLPFELGMREVIIEPYNTSGHGFPSCEVCITSLEDNNNIILLTDGIPVDSLFLNNEERAYFHEGEVDGWTTMPLHIQAEASIQVTKTNRGWWNGISEGTSGSTVLGKRPFQHDVGVMEIIAPSEEVPIDSVILPRAIIRNYGLNVETFTISFLIGDVYSDSQVVTLLPSEKDTISFSEWTANQAGTHIVTCTTLLVEDEHTSNNMKTTQVVVNPGVGPLIYSISPNYGGNTGSVTVEITGSGFLDNAIVKLTRNGQLDYVADTTVVIDTTFIFATLDLRNLELGSWDIFLINPDENSTIFYNGFTIEESIELLWIDIVGSDQIRRGIEQTYNICYGNSGNIDWSGALMLQFPSGWLYSIEIEGISRPDSLVGVYESSGTPIVVHLPSIQVSNSHLFKLNLLVPIETKKTGSDDEQRVGEVIFAWLQPVWDVIDKFRWANKFGDEMGPLVEQIFTQNGFDVDPVSVHENSINFARAYVLKFFQLVMPQFVDHMIDEEIGNISEEMRKNKREEINDQNYENFSENTVEADSEKDVDLVNSWDPNKKTGSSGFGDFNYVFPNRLLQYIIYFENSDSATAPALEIVITDTLDENLDWESLIFGENSHTQSNQLFDSMNGIITWHFEGINLPPNVDPPEGEGWISFTIRTQDDLTTGTEIRNKASIVFDFNPSILTNDFLNTIDASPPSSYVLQLSLEQPLSSFMVEWSGEDDQYGSGIREYSIYVSDNGEPYNHWITTDSTSAIFPGQNEHTYRFYSIAKDNVGHIEITPTIHDAETTIKLLEIAGVSPSPFVPSRGHTKMTFFGAKVPGSKIKIFNKAGDHIKTLEVLEEEETIVWDGKSKNGKNAASGVYIWVLTTPSGKQYRDKFAIIR